MAEKLTGMDAVKSEVKSLSQLARDLGITRGAIAQWDEVPANRVGEISKITNISPDVLRPDIFGVAT